MKKIFKYFGLVLSIALMGAVTGCNIEEINESEDVGLGIKVFFPTKVVAGQPMTINGSGFSDVKEIVFPDGISVTDFEIVSGEMIRVTAPSGISAAGGTIKVVTGEEKAESAEELTLGKTVISGYSKQPGESAQGGDQISIYGTDLEFINAIEMLDVDGNPYIITDKDFYRKGTSTVIIYVPRENIFTGTFAGKVFTYDGQQFTMPELAYEPAPQQGGHWEIQKTILWENEDTPVPIPSWGGTFRFANEQTKTGEEIYAFPMDAWSTIKDGTFRVAVEVSGSSNIRITTGWWSAAYGGGEHNCLDMVQEEEDGTKYIELNIKEDGNIYGAIDEQHLLFTGDAYTLLYIYTVEEVWVPGEAGHWEKTSLWKNDGTPIPSWGGTFRFANEQTKTGEEIYAFPMDVWSLIKDGTVRVAVEVSESSNIRITTGWWSAAYGGTEHNCLDMVQEEEDGTKYIELNIKEDGNIYGSIDEQHLLFTGDAYTLLEIYVMEWVEGGGDTKKPIVLWENDGTPIPSWGGTFRFANEQTKTGEEIYAFPMDAWSIIKDGTFRVSLDNISESSNIRITTGWWSAAYGGTEHNCLDMVQEEEDGTKYIEINLKEDGNLYENIDAQHLLFTGDAYTLLKIYYYE